MEDFRRDYDKEPIVLKDRMPEIGLWFFVSVTFIPLGMILFWMYTSGRSIDWTHLMISLSVLYLPTYYFLKSRIKKRRTITLQNGKIAREWDDETLELEWKDIVGVKRSFIDYYDKRQRLDEFRRKIFRPVLFVLFVLVVHPYLILVKYVYKLFHGFANRRLYDTIVFEGKDDEIIALFIPDNKTYEEIENYLRQKGYGIEEALPTFYSTSYTIDEVTYLINKKVENNG